MNKNRIVYAGFVLVVCLLGFHGLAVGKEVQGLHLLNAEDEQVVRISGDEALPYRVYELDAPPRLVIAFPGAQISPDLEPIKGGETGVTSVFPSQGPEGARVEIGLHSRLTYRVEEKGPDLIVHFRVPKGESASSKAQLTDVEVREVGEESELVLRGRHIDVNKNAFLTHRGKTLILDFWGGESLLPKDHYEFSSQYIEALDVGSANGRLRLVVHLLPREGVGYQLKSGKNEVLLRVGQVRPKRGEGAVVVEDVAFHPSDRIANLVIRTDQSNPIIKIKEKDKAVLLDVEKAVLARGQERSMDVSEFPGPLRQVDVYESDGKVRIVARLREEANVSSYQEGNIMTVTFEPKDLALARLPAGKERIPYTGQKVTFDFKDIDIRNALKLIAEISNLNIIMSDEVTGKLTMRLVDVPWDQALDLILQAKGLGKEKIGNVLRIAPVDVLKAEYEAKLAAQRGSRQLEPLETEYITLNFARVEDVKAMLEGASANKPKGGTPEGETASEETIGLLSPRGSFLIDSRTNTLIIKDTRASINNIKRLLAAIDKPVDQVLIAARIVEAQENFSRDLGIRWGGNFASRSPNITGGGAQNSIDPTTGEPVTTTGARGFIVDLPAATGPGAGGAIGLSFGFLRGAVNLDLELSAAEATDKIKIVSNPRVVVTNLKTAVIDKGTDIPFTTVSQNGTQTEFRKATLGLEVTPQITADNRVIMHVIVSKDTPVSKQENSAIDTQRVETEVFVNNGETVVIGGIYNRDKEQSHAGVPGLSKIPVLGWLFKKRKITDNKTELLIFLTPTILKQSARQTASL